MIVVYVCDENYLWMVERSAQTLLKIHAKARIVIVSPYEVKTSHENIVIPLPENCRHSENDRITSATYLKLLLPRLPFDNIIYLDGDTIIQKPLDELWNMDCEFINLCETYSQKHARDLGVKHYGLSGMMVMNLKALREADFENKCLSAEPKCKIWQHEETLLNWVFNDRLKFINKKWNYCHNRQYDEPIDEDEACILHICGKNKAKMGYDPYSEICPILAYLKGKSVAIVGNAKSIFDKADGKKIDGYDAVIRFNRGFIIRPESQGRKTDILIMATKLNVDEKASYKAQWYVNRSRNTHCGDLTISDEMRRRLKCLIGKQPSSGFMAIDICRTADAKQIALFGFDFEKTPTFYNPEGYKTLHDYETEETIVKKMADDGILSIN